MKYIDSLEIDTKTTQQLHYIGNSSDEINRMMNVIYNKTAEMMKLIDTTNDPNILNIIKDTYIKITKVSKNSKLIVYKTINICAKATNKLNNMISVEAIINISKDLNNVSMEICEWCKTLNTTIKLLDSIIGQNVILKQCSIIAPTIFVILFPVLFYFLGKIDTLLSNLYLS